MTARLEGKVTIITGGASGIGRASARLFAKEGAKVVVADRAFEAAEAVAAEIANGAIALKVDVADSGSVQKMIADTVEHFGSLDVLFNNAGYGIAGTVVETNEDDWAALMAVNVNGVFFGCKYAIPYMRKQGRGVIVNTASGVAKVGIRDRAAYCASKGAVAALTMAMALDHVDENIRINCIAPGTIDSPYFQDMLAKSPRAAEMKTDLEHRQAMKRFGQPEEIAFAALYLACDESSFVTGNMMVVDGGWTIQ